MTAKKCRCPSDSPFNWKHDHRPSMFIKDPFFKGASAMQSKSQTEVVERSRAQGIALGTIQGLSNKSAQTTISVRQFTIYAKAGKVL
jgi:hypothetical protein